MPDLKGTELKSTKLDIVVLGARTEEKSSIAAELEKAKDSASTDALRKRLRGSGARLPAYSVADLTPGKNQPLSVGLVECADMGNVAAAINTAHVILQHEPTLVIFSGIAGSMNSKKIRVGDVLFPRSIRTRYFQKLKVYGGDHLRAGAVERAEILESIKGQLMSFDRTISVSGAAKDLLSHIDSARLKQLLADVELPEDWEKSKGVSRRPVRVVDEEYSFSWDKVLSHGQYIELIRPLLGNSATIVDMESYGFLSAIEKLRGGASESISAKPYATHGIVIRSVSDYAEHKELSDEDPKWRELGLKNMAIATRYVIQEVFSQAF